MSEQLGLDLSWERWPVIYALCDRRDGIVRYIGSTCCDPPSLRLCSHLGRWGAAHRVRAWVSAIGRGNVEMRVLRYVPPALRDVYEQTYIECYAENGFALLNAQRKVSSRYNLSRK